MPKANRANSTRRLTASSQARTSPQRVPGYSDKLPDVYCVKLDGDCLSPLIPDGAAVFLKKSEKVASGDIVAIWFRPESIAPGGHPAGLKRLTLNIPFFVTFPHKDHPNSDVIPILAFEQLNPPQSYTMRCSDVVAVHKAIGYVADAGKIGGTISIGDMLPIGSLADAAG
jgi:hypothetical protein